MDSVKSYLFTRENPSDWVSCQSITKNLVEAYQKNLSSLSLKNLPNELDPYFIEQCVQEINEKQIKRIIFVDHFPCPGPIIAKLDHDLEIIVHLFGDFMLQLEKWRSVGEKSNLKFIAASHKQAKLVKNFIKDECRVDVLAFPLEEEFFSFESETHEKNLVNFIYAGRLNHQKNVLELIEGFINFKQNFNSAAKLKIVGLSDNLGIPYLGKEILPGTFAHQYHQLINTTHVKDDIEYIGPLERDQLRNLYLQSDCFISMSTYNDEDYGMAVAEALACGLTCLLSDWGGYSNFKTIAPEYVELIKIDEQSLKPDLTQLCKTLFKMEQNLSKGVDRQKISQQAYRELSVSAISEKIKSEVLSRESLFTGWNSTLDEVIGQFALMPRAPFSNGKGEYSKLYRQLYRCYWEQT